MNWKRLLEWVLALGIILIPIVLILGIWVPSPDRIWLKVLQTDLVFLCSGFYLYMGMD